MIEVGTGCPAHSEERCSLFLVTVVFRKIFFYIFLKNRL